jgi:hypothetical protein
MIDFKQTVISEMAIHKVGNKTLDEGVMLSDTIYELDDELKDILYDYFLTPFKKEEFFTFVHESDLELNEIFNYAGAIFEDHSQLLEQSIHIAKHLHKQSDHPKIKSGELYVTVLRSCVIGEEIVDAVGIFKSENKDTYLKFADKDLIMSPEKGINVKKLDKGAIIYNTEKEEGYRVLMVDTNSTEARYWRDDFLNIARMQDDSYHTQQHLQLVKEFCNDVVTQDNDKQEEAEFLNRSMEYFQKNESFDIEDFSNKVIEDEERLEQFTEYKEAYEEEKGVQFDAAFNIMEQDVKQMKSKFKSLIKLDTMVDIHLKQNPEDPSTNYVEKGFDEEVGMHYYKVYYNREL